LIDKYGRGKQAMNIGSWSRLLLQVLAFALCTIIGTLLSDWIDETWIIAVSIGAGLIVASVIGVLLEVRKPIKHQNKIEGYSKRILFAPL
jgi:undecaprenyl pyrophosphate phosphatase UppP